MRKWIKVSDRLPKVELDEYDFVKNKVLVCTEGKNIMCINSIHLHDKDSLYYPIVTHWMSLPEPPEEQEK